VFIGQTRVLGQTYPNLTRSKLYPTFFPTRVLQKCPSFRRTNTCSNKLCSLDQFILH